MKVSVKSSRFPVHCVPSSLGDQGFCLRRKMTLSGVCVVNVEWLGGNHRASFVCPSGIIDETSSRHQKDVFRQFCFISLLYLLIYIYMCVIFSSLFGKAQCKIWFTKICVNRPSLFRNTCLQQYRGLDCTWICLLCEGYRRGGAICWGGVQTWRVPLLCVMYTCRPQYPCSHTNDWTTDVWART